MLLDYSSHRHYHVISPSCNSLLTQGQCSFDSYSDQFNFVANYQFHYRPDEGQVKVVAKRRSLNLNQNYDLEISFNLDTPRSRVSCWFKATSSTPDLTGAYIYWRANAVGDEHANNKRDDTMVSATRDVDV